MYKNERGRWNVLEPLRITGAAKKALPASLKKPKLQKAGNVFLYEYEPLFLFNDYHLWQVGDPEGKKTFQQHIALRSEWKKLDPTFAGAVHKSIIEEVFAAYNGKYDRIKDALENEFVWLFATVEKIDLPNAYHPFDHFDNGYVPEGWDRVFNNLRACQDPKNFSRIHSFALAAHAISDFYAHSSYEHFGDTTNGELLTYYDEKDTVRKITKTIDYSPGSAFDLSKFSVNSNYKGTAQARLAAWQGKLVTGRYDQHGDSKSWIERICKNLPDNLVNAPDFTNRMALPHHDEIAVDEEGKTNLLYGDVATFNDHFQRRKNAAIRHIRMVFEKYGTIL
jgi:hypothetical protein